MTTLPTPYQEDVAKALCKAYGNEWDESPETGSGYASGDPRLPAKNDWRRMAEAALTVLMDPLEAILNAAAGMKAAVWLSDALEDETHHTPDEGAECRVCAALGTLRIVLNAFADAAAALDDELAKTRASGQPMNEEA